MRLRLNLYWKIGGGSAAFFSNRRPSTLTLAVEKLWKSCGKPVEKLWKPCGKFRLTTMVVKIGSSRVEIETHVQDQGFERESGRIFAEGLATRYAAPGYRWIHASFMPKTFWHASFVPSRDVETRIRRIQAACQRWPCSNVYASFGQHGCMQGLGQKFSIARYMPTLMLFLLIARYVPNFFWTATGIVTCMHTVCQAKHRSDVHARFGP